MGQAQREKDTNLFKETITDVRYQASIFSFKYWCRACLYEIAFSDGEEVINCPKCNAINVR